MLRAKCQCVSCIILKKKIVTCPVIIKYNIVKSNKNKEIFPSNYSNISGTPIN